MHNLVKYNNHYSKISGSLWQYYRDEPNDGITESESIKFKKLLMLIIKTMLKYVFQL